MQGNGRKLLSQGSCLPNPVFSLPLLSQVSGRATRCVSRWVQDMGPCRKALAGWSKELEVGVPPEGVAWGTFPQPSTSMHLMEVHTIRGSHSGCWTAKHLGGRWQMWSQQGFVGVYSKHSLGVWRGGIYMYLHTQCIPHEAFPNLTEITCLN